MLTFHPEKNGVNEQIKFIRSLFKYFSANSDIRVIISAPNSDLFGDLILNEIKRNLSKNDNLKYLPSLGNKIYYSLIKHVDLVIGNSSSGICEVPTFKPTINIGPRQNGDQELKVN